MNTVLVIDDDDDMRDMIATLLRDEGGYDVVDVAGGRAALEAVKTKHFDLVMTDLRMPDMDGIATLEALKSREPSMQIIVVTGYSSRDMRARCTALGACGYLSKPFDLDEMLHLVESTIGPGAAAH